MKKIFTLTLLLAALLSTQFASAQQTLFVYSKSGDLAAYDVNKVTFDNIFTFTYGDATEITKEMFSASFKVAFKSDACKSLEQTPEVGICFSDGNENPTIADIKIKKGSSLQEYSFSLNGLDAGTTYYYRAYVKVNDAVYYGDAKSETTFGKKTTYTIINGHKFVDLGLPSGLFWAANNIGSVRSADDGEYFAWGETGSKSYYDWSTYKYGTSEGNQTKYNSSDGKTTLDQEDDAAYVNWGSPCRMPTGSEFTELCDSSNCAWTWTSRTASDGSSISGYEVTSVKNGNSIFLPASGRRLYGVLSSHGSSGCYWSSTLLSLPHFYSYANYLWFGSKHFYSDYLDSDERRNGLTIRPVAEP